MPKKTKNTKTSTNDGELRSGVGAREQEIRDLRSKHSQETNLQPAMPAARPVSKADAKKLEALHARFKKKYKEDVFTTIANSSRASNIKTVPSGWQEVDDLITGETDADARTVKGSGLGWPRGRIIEVFGDEGVGKTTIALQIIAAFQRAGERCAFVDAEHALDVSYAKKLGVNLTDLQLSQPDSGGERALTIVHEACDSGLFGCIVVDSVAALVPQSEMEEVDFEKSRQPARQAALMSQALRRMVSTVAKRNVLLVFINQMRMKIGVMFGNPKTTTGGNALKFYASIRLEMVNVKTQRKGDRVVFRRTRIRTVKNKVAAPFRDVFADIAPNKGITIVHGDPDLGGGDD